MTEPFRKCQGRGCFRAAMAGFNFCRDCTDEVLRDAIRRAREDGFTTQAQDAKDGGHGERHE